VSPFIGNPIVRYIDEDFSIKNMPTSTILAQLNIVPTIVEEQGLYEVNMVNHVSKTMDINGVVFDMDAIHYMLFQLPDLLERITAWTMDQQSENELNAIADFVEYLEGNSLRYKARFYEFDDDTHFTNILSDFIYQLFELDDVSLDFNFFTNKTIQPYEVRFYEDFDEDKMVAGIYGMYHVYDRNTYYLESETCNDFNLYSKITREEKEAMILSMDVGNYYEEDECYFYLYEKLDHDLSFELVPEVFYPHENTFLFDYQSYSTKPYARFRLVFDYFYEEKLMISSETMNVKISKEANDYRNQYNVEFVEVYGEIKPIPVDMIYPYKTLIEDKEMWFYTQSNYFHQMLEGNQKNVKYRKDRVYYDGYTYTEELGGLELIYDRIGLVVYDPLTTFTFNYGSSDLTHYLKDVYPFLLWGTSIKNREEFSIDERFIWDKDRFTIYRSGHVLEKNALREYYDRRLKNVIIGSEVPIELLDQIDEYYDKTR
jgi:hypothetical protein